MLLQLLLGVVYAQSSFKSFSPVTVCKTITQRSDGMILLVCGNLVSVTTISVYHPNTTLLQSVTLNGPLDMRKIVIDKLTNNVHISGLAQGSYGGQPFVGLDDCVIMQLYSNLTVSWVRMMGTTSYDSFDTMTSIDQRGVLICSGHVAGVIDGQTNYGQFDIIVVWYYTNGTKFFTITIGSATYDLGYYAISYNGDSAIVGGAYNKLGFVARFFYNSTISQYFVTQPLFEVWALYLNADGFMYATGYAYNACNSQTTNCMVLARFGPETGIVDQSYTKLFGGSVSHKGNDIVVDMQQNLIHVIGTLSTSPQTTDQRYMYSLSGQLLYNGPIGGTDGIAVILSNYTLYFVGQNGNQGYLAIVDMSPVATTTATSTTTTSSTKTSTTTTLTSSSTTTSSTTTTVTSSTTSVKSTSIGTDSVSSSTDFKQETLQQLVLTYNGQLLVTTAVTSIPGQKNLQTTAGQNSSQLDQLMEIIPYMIIVCGVLFVIGLLLCVFICRSDRKNRKQQRQQVSLPPSYGETRTDSVFTGLTTSSGLTTHVAQTQTAYATLISTQHEMSLPAFLERQCGIDFRLGAQLDKGGAGVIQHCDVMDASVFGHAKGVKLVAKNLGVDFDNLSADTRASFNQEIAMLHMFRDQPYFARFYGYSTNPACLVLKFYEYGSLKMFVFARQVYKPRQVYSKTQLFVLLNQMCEGLQYMHSKGYAHCDIKPENVLLELNPYTKMLEPKWTDFGISRLVDSSSLQVQAFAVSRLNGASLSYASREALLRLKKNQNMKVRPAEWYASDIYSMALVMMVMIKRQHVWTK